MNAFRQAIQTQVRTLIGSPSAALDIDAGEDVGLFGPGAVCWRVHGDFITMMIGGVTALLLHMLHPGALAGVWDHSDFRKDMRGRLRRTAQFVAGTTYGSTATAEALLARVLKIHDSITGYTPYGRAYSAHDPDLLTWVHVAEVTSFLRAYLRYKDPNLPLADQDRYFGETATIAIRLGAVAPPRTWAEVDNYIAGARTDLRADARTQEVAHVLLSQSAPSPAMAPFAALIFQAAMDLLPDWAREMHGFGRSAVPSAMLSLTVARLDRAVSWGVPDTIEGRARHHAAKLRANSSVSHPLSAA
jgi:uncharacterized protein (DUF2236 family)